MAYDAIYLAPHFDDIALSVGGQVRQRTWAGERVLVVTMTGKSPDLKELPPSAQSHHAEWGLDKDAVGARRVEDIQSSLILGADYRHWPYLDCIYRFDPDTEKALYQSDEVIFGEVSASEEYLVNSLTEMMRQLPASKEVFAPLTVGNHVDHQIMRRSAELAFSHNLAYYEDYPYVVWHNFEQPSSFRFHYPNSFSEVGNITYQFETIEITEPAIVARLAATAAYTSQVPFLFPENDMEEMMRTYIAKVGGERIWRHRQD